MKRIAILQNLDFFDYSSSFILLAKIKIYSHFIRLVLDNSEYSLWAEIYLSICLSVFNNDAE
jgi:hypothetical protein